jgi:hypothetical protein
MIDFETLRRAAIFYCCLELKSDFRSVMASRPFSDMDEKTFRRELRPLLRRDTIFPLKKATEAVNGLVRGILALEEEEKGFVEAFYRLDYRPDLLFPSNPALKHHPGAEWRLRMLARKSRSSMS